MGNPKLGRQLIDPEQTARHRLGSSHVSDRVDIGDGVTELETDLWP